MGWLLSGTAGTWALASVSAMVLVGLIFVLGVVQVDIPYVDEYALGVLLIVMGIVGVALTLFAWNRARTRVIEQCRIDDPGLP